MDIILTDHCRLSLPVGSLI